MGAAVAGPIFANLFGAALASQGSKKAAKNSQPQIPAEFQNVIRQATGLISQRMQFGAPAFKGQRIAGPTGAQNSLLARGQAGLTSAFDTVRRISETGLDESAVRTIESRLNPFFERQRSNIQAGAREASAQRGSFFGTGSLGAERDALNRFEETRSASILPMALQIQQQQLGAAGALPGMLGQSIQAADLPRQINQSQFDFDFSEFIRQQPENAINLLAPLLGGGGVPFFVPPSPLNFGQAAGAGITNMAQSPGFANLFANTGGSPATSNNSYFGGADVFQTGGGM